MLCPSNHSEDSLPQLIQYHITTPYHFAYHHIIVSRLISYTLEQVSLLVGVDVLLICENINVVIVTWWAFVNGLIFLVFLLGWKLFKFLVPELLLFLEVFLPTPAPFSGGWVHNLFYFIIWNNDAIDNMLLN